MITVPEATKKIIERSRYLSEAISKGIINYSSLARYIRPELEQMLMKKVSNASIVMALNRLEPYFKPKYNKTKIFKSAPEIIVRSNLMFVTLSNQGISDDIFTGRQSPELFFTKTQGINETNIIMSKSMLKRIEGITKKENIIVQLDDLSAITVRLPKEALQASGIYYFFLKSLAWEGVNIIDIVSTLSELTIVVEDKDTERTFAIIKSLFSS